MHMHMRCVQQYVSILSTQHMYCTEGYSMVSYTIQRPCILYCMQYCVCMRTVSHAVCVHACNTTCPVYRYRCYVLHILCTVEGYRGILCTLHIPCAVLCVLQIHCNTARVCAWMHMHMQCVQQYVSIHSYSMYRGLQHGILYHTEALYTVLYAVLCMHILYHVQCVCMRATPHGVCTDTYLL